MRFRAKFGALDWCFTGAACLFAGLWLSGLRHSAAGILVLLFPLIALQRVLLCVFIYWELGSDGLRERRFWSTREIPWSEIKRIGSWHPKQPSSDYLEIDFDRAPPISERGRIIANPEDRRGFIAGLRKFAPQAEFEV